MSSRPRVVVAGLGDTGLLTAIHLVRWADVVGISTKPGLVSGQELGMRLARPHEWARSYWITYDRFRRLDAARIVHGSVVGMDPEARTIDVRAADGTRTEEPYDVLVIATGVSNGFWRTPDVQDSDEVSSGIAAAHGRIGDARSVIVIGGGAAAVSTAWNIAGEWPAATVDLYFPGDRALVSHHPRVWETVRRRFEHRGVGLHPGHRAVVPPGFRGDRITDAPVEWSTGQPASSADAVVWAIGQVHPNTAWLPRALLDARGFVEVDEYLRVPAAAGVYAVGDVAATDPLRSSARARADRLLARNIRADLGSGTPRRFEPAGHRWGSVIGPQGNRLEVFAPNGRAWTIPAWDTLQPWLVSRGIYRGIRPD